MTQAQALLPEFDEEMAKTREVLKAIPDDRFDWRAHPRTHTIGWNANHVSDIVHWLATVFQSTEFDVAPVGQEPHKPSEYRTTGELLEQFDRNVAEARAELEKATDSSLAVPWSLLAGGQPLFTMTRAALIRSMVMNHIIHHRAHICAYLRVCELPVPGMYGPA